MKRSEIRLTGCQLKSIRIAKDVARHLAEIEAMAGIRTVKITLEDCFICSDVSKDEWDTLNTTPMEKGLRSIIKKLTGI